MTDWLKDILDKPTTTVPLAGKVLGLSRTAAYESVLRGEIEVLTFGRKKVVPTAWLRKKLQIGEAA
jgi:hypothetical protein